MDCLVGGFRVMLNATIKILAVEYILLLQFCDKFGLGVKKYICSLPYCKTVSKVHVPFIKKLCRNAVLKTRGSHN